MSLRPIIRFSVYSLSFFAVMLLSMNDTVEAQNQGVPKLGRPTLGGAGGAEGGNTGRPKPGGDWRTNGGGQPPGMGRGRNGGRSSGGSSKTSSKPKFVELLDSKDLSAFRGYASEEIGDGWSIDGRYLYFDGSSDTGDIITKEQYSDFELQFEFKISEGGNSGVMYRVSTGDSAPYMSGPEYQVLDDANHDDGKNELTSAGSLYALYAPEDKKTRAAGQWNQAKVKVVGNKITHYLNKVKVLEAEIGSDDWNKRLGESKFKDWDKFAKNAKGHIAFQDHGDEVWYRKIRIKRLSDDGGSSRAADRGGMSDRERAEQGSVGRGRQGSGRAGAKKGRSRGPQSMKSSFEAEEDNDKDKDDDDR
ncbi:MAG: DUF1080 domain-containing protein [Mariniblastus sp.]